MNKYCPACGDKTTAIAPDGRAYCALCWLKKYAVGHKLYEGNKREANTARSVHSSIRV